MSNPFGGSVFGSMWEDATKYTEQRAKDCKNIMQQVINKKTGALSDAVEIEKIDDYTYKVGINEIKLMNDPRNAGGINYVKYYYYGSEPHIIRKKNKMLRFVINGNVVYRPYVKHPGNKPHNFIQDTLDKMR